MGFGRGRGGGGRTHPEGSSEFTKKQPGRDLRAADALGVLGGDGGAAAVVHIPLEEAVVDEEGEDHHPRLHLWGAGGGGQETGARGDRQGLVLTLG